MRTTCPKCDKTFDHDPLKDKGIYPKEKICGCGWPVSIRISMKNKTSKYKFGMIKELVEQSKKGPVSFFDLLMVDVSVFEVEPDGKREWQQCDDVLVNALLLEEDDYKRLKQEGKIGEFNEDN
nr:MAG TPA: zinc-ribbon domain protein [Caudoviricetes sp.]